MRSLGQDPSPALVRLAIATALVFSGSAASALPSGRAWAPVTRLAVPGFAYASAPRLELDSNGSPQLITLTVFPSDVFAFDWADSIWLQRWRFGRGAITLWPVQSPPGTHHLVWRGVAPVGDERLFMAEVLEGGIQEPDTVASVALSTEYSGAVSAKRRWVAVSDVVAIQRKLRVLYSDTVATWRDAPIQRSFGSIGGVAVATTGDSTALVAWEENFRLRWATLEGTQWTEGAPFPDLSAFRMQFRRRPSGGQWLASAGGEPHVFLRSYHDAIWSPPETLRCAYRDGLPNHYADTPDLSRDGGEYPVIVWDAQNIRANNTICVCVPTDSGYGIAEELEGVEGNLGLPTAARDRNGEVWVAWYVVGGDVRWIHSYVRATAGDLRVEGHGRHRRVAWTLSEPAPETWWAVLRARGPDDLEEVARVRAGAELEMSWTDTSPPGGVLRYKIRRESVDARYLWESAVVRVPEKSRGLILRLAVPLPIVQRATLQLENAESGPFQLRLFDVQGRMVHQHGGSASGTGQDTIAFDLATAGVPLPNGVYFAAVRDAGGQVSQVVRLVILR